MYTLDDTLILYIDRERIEVRTTDTTKKHVAIVDGGQPVRIAAVKYMISEADKALALLALAPLIELGKHLEVPLTSTRELGDLRGRVDDLAPRLPELEMAQQRLEQAHEAVVGLCEVYGEGQRVLDTANAGHGWLPIAAE